MRATEFSVRASAIFKRQVSGEKTFGIGVNGRAATPCSAEHRSVSGSLVKAGGTCCALMAGGSLPFGSTSRARCTYEHISTKCVGTTAEPLTSPSNDGRWFSVQGGLMPVVENAEGLHSRVFQNLREVQLAYCESRENKIDLRGA